MKGYDAADRLCVGSIDPKVDDHTTICLPSATFTMVTKVIDWRWSGRANAGKHIDSTCGLGKEPASKRSQSWFAKSVYLGLFKNNTYSIALAPQSVQDAPYKFGETKEEAEKRSSYLTLGGWDDNDKVGSIIW